MPPHERAAAARRLSRLDEMRAEAERIARAECRLDHLPASLAPAAVAMVVESGITDLPNRLAWRGDPAGAVAAALAAGGEMLADEAMLATGIAARLPGVTATAADAAPEAALMARELGLTKAAAGLALCGPRLDGAIIAIGADTQALDTLIALMGEGRARPAALIAMPSGLVGAAEAKAQLAAGPGDAPYLTLRGRRGGPQLCLAALSALAGARR